jgi:hypothetical protein
MDLISSARLLSREKRSIEFMAEGRMLKKVICESPRLAALKNDTHRLLYTWLIPHLDVEGRHSADARIVKSHVAPILDHITHKIITSALVDMADNDLIVLYSLEGKDYLELQRFSKHQTLREGREKKSDIPPPTDGVPTEFRRATAQQVKLREVKLREDKGTPPVKVRHLDSVFLSRIEYQKLQEALGQKNLDTGIEKLDYSITVKGGKYKDHYKTLLNWSKRGYLTDGGNGQKQPGSSHKESRYVVCPNCKKEVFPTDLNNGRCIHCEARKPLAEIWASMPTKRETT